MTPMEIIAMFGIPSAITGVFFGILNSRIQKKLDEQEARRKKEEEKREKKEEEREKREEQREKDREKLILMQLQSARAAVVLSEATARAVQRIPDAKCNGDMTSALERAAKIQRESKEFLFEKGIHSLYSDDE